MCRNQRSQYRYAFQRIFVGGTGKENTENQEKRSGRAPALIVDMKATIRYMRHNAKTVPGDVEKIITNGTSAGGALSALAGATGNAKQYESYLKAIGAAEERDDILRLAVIVRFIIWNMRIFAYEWLFQKEPVFHMMKFEMSPKGPKMIPVVGELSDEQKKLSAELKAEFPAYVNSLGLKDDNGIELTLEENGEGTFKDYVMSFVSASAKKKKKHMIPA